MNVNEKQLVIAAILNNSKNTRSFLNFISSIQYLGYGLFKNDNIIIGNVYCFIIIHHFEFRQLVNTFDCISGFIFRLREPVYCYKLNSILPE